MESFFDAPNRPDHFISVDPIGTFTRKPGEYLVGYTRGDYGELGDLPKRLSDYAAEHSLNITGPVYTLYLLEEICLMEPSQYLAQCCVAISKRKVRDSSAVERRKAAADRRNAAGDRRSE